MTHIARDSSSIQIRLTVVNITHSKLLKQIRNSKFLINNQPEALIIQIYSVIKFYMLRASSLPIIRSFLLYIRHW